jgi:hypothetical protein
MQRFRRAHYTLASASSRPGEAGDADKISDEAAAAVAVGDGCAQPVAAARLGPAAASAVANQMARLEG